MKQFIDVVNLGICNYDGKCLFRDEDTGYAYCYGQKYGTDECPLYTNIVQVFFKDDREMAETEKSEVDYLREKLKYYTELVEYYRNKSEKNKN